MLPLSSSVLFTYSAPLVCVHSCGVCLKLLHCRTGVPCLGFSAVKSLVWQVAWARSECRKSQPHPSPSQPQMCLSALPFLGSRGCLASAHDVPVSSSLVTFRHWTVQFMLLIPPPLLAPLLWRLLLGWEDQCLVQRSSCCSDGWCPAPGGCLEPETGPYPVFPCCEQFSHLPLQTPPELHSLRLPSWVSLPAGSAVGFGVCQG